MNNLADNVMNCINILIALLLVSWVILWIIGKIPRKRVYHTLHIQISDSGNKPIHEEVKEVANTSELMAEVIRSVETITQDKKKSASFRITNTSTGGYTVKSAIWE